MAASRKRGRFRGVGGGIYNVKNFLLLTFSSDEDPQRSTLVSGRILLAFTCRFGRHNLLEKNIVLLKKCTAYADFVKSLIHCYPVIEETEIDGELRERADEKSHPLPLPVIDLTGIE